MPLNVINTLWVPVKWHKTRILVAQNGDILRLPKTMVEARVQSEVQPWDYVFLSQDVGKMVMDSSEQGSWNHSYLNLISGCLKLTLEVSYTFGDLNTQCGAGNTASVCCILDITSNDQYHEIHSFSKYLLRVYLPYSCSKYWVYRCEQSR